MSPSDRPLAAGCHGATGMCLSESSRTESESARPAGPGLCRGLGTGPGDRDVTVTAGDSDSDSGSETGGSGLRPQCESRSRS